jgi:hypothetical protein
MLKIAATRSGVDAAHRLDALGLTIELVRDAVLAGVAARAACTEHDPATLPGTLLSGRAIRALRDMLTPRGWRKETFRGLELVVNPTGRTAITAAVARLSGHGTSTRHPKGPAMQAVLSTNREVQLDLFEAAVASPATTEEKGKETWILLIHFHRTRVDFQLSLPDEMDADGRVSSWLEHIVFSPIGQDVPVRTNTADDEPEIVVPLSKRNC